MSPAAVWKTTLTQACGYDRRECSPLDVLSHSAMVAVLWLKQVAIWLIGRWQ